MDRSRQNKRTKFGTKIFRSYRVITFYVLGHLFSHTLYICNYYIKNRFNLDTGKFSFSNSVYNSLHHLPEDIVD